MVIIVPLLTTVISIPLLITVINIVLLTTVIIIPFDHDDQCTFIDHSDQHTFMINIPLLITVTNIPLLITMINVPLLITMINVPLLITMINVPFTDIFPDAVEEDGSQQEHHRNNKDIDHPGISYQWSRSGRVQAINSSCLSAVISCKVEGKCSSNPAPRVVGVADTSEALDGRATRVYRTVNIANV